MQQSNIPLQKPVLNIFDSLNPQQVEAVCEIEHPLLIIAGAGSGKTLTVASKIAYLIEQGIVSSESILALTFNQKAAEELKSRVMRLLNTSEDFNISTFHSFCNQVIQDNILNTKLNANFRILTDTAQLVYFTKNINNFGIEHLEFNYEPYTLAEEMKKFISRCKDEFVSPKDLQLYIEEHENATMTEDVVEDLKSLKDILKIYQAYERYKLQNNMLDFGDMLCIVYDLLKTKPLILRKYQEKFKFIIVDEFQDTNYIQLQIVSLIAGQQGHLTVVGDDDQSIYQFRGAQLTNIAEFKVMFPNFVEKTLEHNYRSTKKIVAVSNALIENGLERTTKKIYTENPEGDNIDVVETPNDTTQVNYILEVVTEFLRKYSPQDIAILCRRRSTAEPIIKAFRKQNIPFNFIGETGFFQQPIIKDVTAFLRVICNPLENNAEFVRVISRRSYNIKQVDICKFNRYAEQHKLSLYETLEHINTIGVDKRKFSQVKQTLTNVMNNHKRIRPIDLVHTILFEQDFYKYEIALKNNRNMQLINQFYEFAEEYNSIYPDNEIEDFVEYLTLASNFEIEEDIINEQAIVISTIHGVKGMQYPVVILPDVNERKIPTIYQKDKFPIPKELLKGVQSLYDDKELHLQEERRLFYVALSRAKEKLVITYAKRFGENKTDSKPSRFLREINYQQNANITFQQTNSQTTTVEADKDGKVQIELTTTPENRVKTELMHRVVSNLVTGQFNEAIEHVLLYAKSTCKDLDLQNEIISKIKEPDYYTLLEDINKTPLTVPSDHIFSVSQFVSYKKCPRLYQYRHILKIPEKPKYYFDFGSTIHRVVEQLTKLQKEKQTLNETIAYELLDTFWNPKSYKSDLDAKRGYDIAKNVLQVFLEEQHKATTEILDIERPFETTIGDVRIRGRIDRIDKDSIGTIQVIDYKTGKRAKSLNELKKDMQLLVYTLAIKDMYNRDEYRQVTVGEWFLQPNIKHFFTPEKQDIETIQTEIQEMAKKIDNAQFEQKPGWECRDCDYKCLCD